MFQLAKENVSAPDSVVFAKSISNYDFTTGHYNPGFARCYIKEQLDKNEIHVAVLGCYINPTNPVKSWQKRGIPFY